MMQFRTKIGILATALAVAFALPGMASATPAAAPQAPSPATPSPQAPSPATPSPQAPSPAAPAVKKTVVQKFKPFTKAGTLKRKTKVAVDLNPADCTRSPVAAAKNIYTCGSASQYLPACWKAPKLYRYGTMVCLQTPQDKTYTIVSSDTMPKNVKKPKKAEPWQIRLTDGSVCTIRLGGAWGPAPDGFHWSYSCSGKTELLLAPDSTGRTLITKNAVNTVRTATMKRNGTFTPIKKVKVAKVIYAGATPKNATKKAKARATCPTDAQLNRALPTGLSVDRSTATVCVGKWAGRVVNVSSAPSPDFAVFTRVKSGKWKQFDLYTKPTCKGTHAAFISFCALPF